MEHAAVLAKILEWKNKTELFPMMKSSADIMSAMGSALGMRTN